MIGGMSWESTADYYRIINTEVRRMLGGLHSARLLLYSFDFEPIEALQSAGKWNELAESLVEVALGLEIGGAEILLICTNTMHKVADQVESAVTIPLLHIADAAGAEVISLGKKRVGLLGTRFTMQEDFYAGRLRENHGIDVLVPKPEHQDTVHRIIYEELCLGEVREDSRKRVTDIISDLTRRGADAVLLGCTELPILVGDSDCGVPVLDTTALHAKAAVNQSLAPPSRRADD